MICEIRLFPEQIMRRMKRVATMSVIECARDRWMVRFVYVENRKCEECAK